MLTNQMLQQMLLDSIIARQYFQQAKAGLLFNNHYYDLFYDSQLDRISSMTSLNQPVHNPYEQMILRIHAQDPSKYISPELDFKGFVSMCLLEYNRLFHLLISQEQEQQLQQTLQHQQVKHRGLIHDEGLEL